MRHLIKTIAPKEIADTVAAPDDKVLFPFEIGAIAEGRLNK